MNRLVRGGSLLIAAAVLAACGAHQQEKEQEADSRAAQAATTPAEPVAQAPEQLAKSRRDTSLEEVVMTGNQVRTETYQAPMPIMVAGATSAAVAQAARFAAENGQPEAVVRPLKEAKKRRR